jgi:hypothetical protein
MNGLKKLALFAQGFTDDPTYLECELDLVIGGDTYRTYAMTVTNSRVIFHCPEVTIEYGIEFQEDGPVAKLYNVT